MVIKRAAWKIRGGPFFLRKRGPDEKILIRVIGRGPGR